MIEIVRGDASARLNVLREALLVALPAAGRLAAWQEWAIDDPALPEYLERGNGVHLYVDRRPVALPSDISPEGLLAAIVSAGERNPANRLTRMGRAMGRAAPVL